MNWIRGRRWFRRKTLGILVAKLILGCATDLAAQTHVREKAHNPTPQITLQRLAK